MTKNMKALSVAISLAVLGLSGCAAVAPQGDFKAEMPGAFKNVYVSDVKAHHEWWKSMGDQQLNALVDLGIESNSDIQIAAAQLLSAQAVLKGSEASFFPVLDLALSDSKGRQGTGSEETMITETKKAQVSISYELDIWGRIADIRDSKEAALAASEQDQQSVRLSVISSIITGYLHIRQYDEEIRTLREISDNTKKLLSVVEFSASEGYAKNDEVEKAKITLSEAESALERKIEQRGKAENALSVLVGKPDYALAPDPAYKLKGFDMPSPDVPSSLLEHRPDLIRAEYELKSADANIKVAKKAFFPQINLTGSIGSQSGQLNGLMKSGADIWSAGVGIDLPIFDGGLRMSNLLQSKADQQASVAQYRKAIRNAFSEVNDSLLTLDANKKVHTHAKNSLDSSLRTFALVTDRYSHGYESYIDMLNEANNMLNNKMNEIEIRYQVSQDIVSFNKSLGF